ISVVSPKVAAWPTTVTLPSSPSRRSTGRTRERFSASGFVIVLVSVDIVGWFLRHWLQKLLAQHHGRALHQQFIRCRVRVLWLVLECASLVRRHLRGLNRASDAIDPRFEVAAHETIKVVLDIEAVAAPAEQFQVHLTFEGLRPLADQ